MADNFASVNEPEPTPVVSCPGSSLADQARDGNLPGLAVAENQPKQDQNQNRMKIDPNFAALASRVLDSIERCPDEGVLADEEFTGLALELFKLQFGSIPVYRDFCRVQGAEPGRVSDWRKIPAVPTRAFKEWELTSLPEEDRTRVFLSSGTTARSLRSRHYHNAASLRVYEASLKRWFGRHLLPDQKAGARLRFVALTPSGSQAPESSLVHMLETVTAAFKFKRVCFLGRAGDDGMWFLDLPQTLPALEGSVSQGEPVVLLGTAFLFVHFLEHLAERHQVLALPPGSRVMETGGYKGQSRVLEREQLHQFISERLGIPPSHIVSEYGMSELSSQAYDRVAGAAAGDAQPDNVFRFPPWARVQVISPESGREVAEGEIGLVRVYDLANVYSVMAVQTEDLAIRRGAGVQLIGRAPQAEPRGCSLMADQLAPA